MNLNIKRSENNQLITLALSGRIDTITAPELQKSFLKEIEVSNRVILDFAEVSYISSAGLRVLLSGAKIAKAKGGEQVLSNVTKDIKEVFQMTGLADILNIR